MAGLLDAFDLGSPQGAAMAQMAQGLLGGGSNAQRFAGAGATYAQMMQLERAKALREAEIKQMMEARAQEMQARQKQMQEAEAAKRQQGMDEGLAKRLLGMPVEGAPAPDGMGPGLPQRNPGIDPRAFLAQGGSMQGLPGALALGDLFKPKPKNVTVSSPGQIGRYDDGTEAWRNPSEQKEDEFIGQLRAAGIDPASPQGVALLQSRVRKQATHAPAASATVVLPPQEKEENKRVGQYFGDQYADIQKSGLAAGQTINRLGQMKAMAQGLETGKLAPLATDIAAYARGFGINIDPKLEAKEAFNAMSNEMALQMRNPAGGAGMPGALSDKDREFLMNIVPGLSKTPGGNAQIIEARAKLARREQVVAKLARDYRSKNGTLDEGFYEELQRYADANPLYDGMTPAAGGAKPTVSNW